MTYYHVTKEEKLKSIFETGLVPQIGENSKDIGETEEAIYLCSEKDIPYWTILLGSTVVLEVTLEQEINEDAKLQYSHYNEWKYYSVIPPENLKRVSLPTEDRIKDALLCLQWSYTLILCDDIMYVSKGYHHEHFMFEDDVYYTLHCTIEVMKKLKYTELSAETKRSWLQDYGDDGAYTFCDTYCDTDLRMYQFLIHISDEKTYAIRKETYDFILEAFAGCLDVDTGGYCGD